MPRWRYFNLGWLMDKQQKVLAIVPARAGSKGVVDKNIRMLHGKPLLAWTIEAALNVDDIQDVVLSTDSEHYAQIGREYGAWVPFLREAKFATDDASLMSSIQHTLDRLAKEGKAYDVVVVLQPTSPLRTANHIREALNLFLAKPQSPKSLASVYEVNAKYRLLLNINDESQLRFVDDKLNQGGGFNRQSNSPVYMPNGAIFIYQTQALSAQYQPSTCPYVMTEASSLDIDTVDDFQCAEVQLSQMSVDAG